MSIIQSEISLFFCDYSSKIEDEVIIKMTTYRNEHPKPQFERKNWRNLNGKWQFEIDFGKTAKERKLFKNNIDLKETTPRRIGFGV